MAIKKLTLDSPIYGITNSYVVVTRNSDGYFLDDLGVFVSGVPTFPVLTEDVNVKGRYSYSSSSVWTNGHYSVRFYQRLGASQDLAVDTLIGIGQLFIYSDAEVSIEEYESLIKIKTDYLPADTAAELIDIKTRISAIQNNTRFVGIAPLIIRPVSGFTDFIFFGQLFDSTGAPNDPDFAVMNITIKDTSGNTIVPLTAMSRDQIGVYRFVYTVLSTDTDMALVVYFSYDENTVSFLQVRTTEIVPFSDTILTQLSLIKAKTDNLPSDPASQSSVLTSIAGVAAAVWSYITRTLTSALSTPVTIGNITGGVSGSDLIINSWLTTDGQTVVNPTSCQLEVMKADGTVYWSTPVNTSPDVGGIFRFTKPLYEYGNTTKTYYVKITIVSASITYTTIRELNIYNAATSILTFSGVGS